MSLTLIICIIVNIREPSTEENVSYVLHFYVSVDGKFRIMAS